MHTAVLAANEFVLMAGALGAGKFHLRLRTNIVLLRHGIFYGRQIFVKLNSEALLDGRDGSVVVLHSLPRRMITEAAGNSKSLSPGISFRTIGPSGLASPP